MSAAASKTAKTTQASTMSKAKGGTSAQRAARGRVVSKKTQAPAGDLPEPIERVHVGRRGRGVGPTVRQLRVTEPRLLLQRPDAAERAKLRELEALVAGGQDIEEIVVVGAGERRVPLTRTLLEGLAALGKVFEALDRGPSVTVVTDDNQAELTSQETADLLNVSRPHVVKLARGGVLAHHRVGNRHRFSLADVLDYRDQMHAVREEALAALAPADGYSASDF